MKVESEELLLDGSFRVLLTGSIERFLSEPIATQHGGQLRCAGHRWNVHDVELPDPEGGMPIARVVMRGLSTPRRGMQLRFGNEPLGPDEVDLFIEGLVHFYKIVTSIDGAMIGEALSAYQAKVGDVTEVMDAEVAAFRRLAVLVKFANDHLTRTESTLEHWRMVAAKVRSIL